MIKKGNSEIEDNMLADRAKLSNTIDNSANINEFSNSTIITDKKIKMKPVKVSMSGRISAHHRNKLHNRTTLGELSDQSTTVNAGSVANHKKMNTGVPTFVEIGKGLIGGTPSLRSNLEVNQRFRSA